MPSPVFRLNPTLPLLWQTTRTLQIGFDPPVVVIDDVDDGILALLPHFVAGITEPGLRMFQAKLRLPEGATDTLLEALAPALCSVAPAPPAPYVLDGPRDLVTHARGVLEGLGHACHTGPRRTAPGADPPELFPPGEVLVLAHYVPHPEQFYRWLRVDRPHTPVIFTDQAVTIGPRIVPGQTPCLHCELSSRLQRETTMTAIYSQLWGKPAPTATEASVRQATWRVHQMLQGTPANSALRCTDTAAVETSAAVRRPTCCCLGLV